MLRPATILTLLFFCGVLPLAVGQNQDILPERIGGDVRRGPSLSALEKKAQKSFQEGKYFAAMKYYQQILDVDTFQVSARIKYAEAASANTQFELAAGAYGYLLENRLVQGDDSLRVSLAQADAWYHMGDRYDKAKQRYEQLLPHSLTHADAEAGIKRCEWAMSVIDKQDRVVREPVPNVNTRFSEYSGRWTDDRLYYSSYSFPYRGDSAKTLIKLMTAEPQDDGSSAVRELTEINEENKHTAYVALNASKTVMYYAVGEYNSNKRVRFELFRRKRAAGGVWGEPEKLPETINMRGYTTTQPHVALLPGDETETLFFVSNRPGGQGKKDIWYSRIEQDSFSAPVNLADLNTDEDDVTPFYHSATQTLYFSSIGRSPSLGGFDIFSARLEEGKWSDLKHLPLPLNSNANDVFFSMTEDGKLMFLSSNRNGATNYSEEECCYDIFRYRRPSVSLIVTVMDGDSLKPFPGANVALSPNPERLLGDLANGRPERTLLDTLLRNLPDSSQYFYPLAFEHNYSLFANKEGFTADSADVSTIGLNVVKDTLIRRELTLRRGLQLETHVFDDLTKDPLNDVTITLVELRQALKWVHQTGPNSNRFDTLIFYDTRYRVIASKEGYSKDSTEFRTDNLEKKPFQRIRRDLYLRPLCLKCYLPIVLYFDNDEPGPRKRGVDTTASTYFETYVPYYNRKETYIREYTKGMTREQMLKDSMILDSFFESRVKAEWERMIVFTDVLFELLSENERNNSTSVVKIQISGFASPLAQSDYNKSLSNRRVDCIKNQFLEEWGGTYGRFIDNGLLYLEEVPNGDSLAPKTVNEDPRKRRLSVYSVAASGERRVEIVGIEDAGQTSDGQDAEREKSPSRETSQGVPPRDGDELPVPKKK